MVQSSFVLTSDCTLFTFIMDGFISLSIFQNLCQGVGGVKKKQLW